VYGCQYYYSQWDTIRINAAFGCDCQALTPECADTCDGNSALGIAPAKYQEKNIA
jgi:hypothetical protein